MFGIGLPEFILILVVGLIVFGPSKLPELGRAVGKGMREFRKASNALQAAINAPDEPVERPSAPAAARAPEAAETVPTAGEEAAPPKETAAQEPETSSVSAASGYCPPTQESVRAQLEEQQKL
ncbi:MAG: twin-arginine translocase TatA/TatE family subunit [Selenomonadaceae bacterium]|nr:twin-arginine translocase TatA/TatE family subunit [Selenomonadaceae bacterium]